MITINLKPGAKRQAPKGSSFVVLRERVAALGQSIKQPALVIAIGAWVLVALFVGVMFVRTRSRLGKLQPRMENAQNEYRRYHGFVTLKKRQMAVRDSILTQIGTISSVDQDRYVWPHILDEISAAMPDFTWLTTITPVTATAASTETDSTVTPPVSVLITGQTNDLQNYTAFLRRLGDSHWLTNVTPVKTETIIANNRPITSFTVQATFTRADSSQIQTVPILESTVR